MTATIPISSRRDILATIFAHALHMQLPPKHHAAIRTSPTYHNTRSANTAIDCDQCF
jgi:hypothetical protein